jgi:hypothetical protein
MSIKSRLNELQSQIIGNASEFCACNGLEQQVEFQQRTIEYNAYETGEYVPYQNSKTAKELGLESDAEPPTIENCQRCGKPINKRVIILELIK